MSETSAELPRSSVPGLIPTLNNTGWMTENLDRMSQDFAAYAGSIPDESLDVGCAYGIATLAALAQGARVLAADLDPRHLEILVGRTPADQKSRLRTAVASLPGVDFPDRSFGAILAARVLHFLGPADLNLTLYKMQQWLTPCGRAYIICDSPFVGPWRDAAPEYERRRAAGCPFPGLVIDYHKYLPEASRATAPSFMHPMDPDTLVRIASKLGFEVLEAAWLEGGTKYKSARDHAGVVLRRAG